MYISYIIENHDINTIGLDLNDPNLGHSNIFCRLSKRDRNNFSW